MSLLESTCVAYTGWSWSQLTENISLVLTGMLRYEAATHFVERYQGVVSYATDMEDLITSNFCKFSKY
jgi:hypothetical protein